MLHICRVYCNNETGVYNGKGGEIRFSQNGPVAQLVERSDVHRRGSVIKGFVYILRSCKNGRFYVGSTLDVSRRFKEHENGFVRATKNMRPVELKFFQEYDTIALARRIEYKIKRLKNKQIIERILHEGIITMGQ